MKRFGWLGEEEVGLGSDYDSSGQRVTRSYIPMPLRPNRSMWLLRRLLAYGPQLALMVSPSTTLRAERQDLI